jgi:hypothetical protein
MLDSDVCAPLAGGPEHSKSGTAWFGKGVKTEHRSDRIPNVLYRPFSDGTPLRRRSRRSANVLPSVVFQTIQPFTVFRSRREQAGDSTFFFLADYRCNRLCEKGLGATHVFSIAGVPVKLCTCHCVRQLAANAELFQPIQRLFRLRKGVWLSRKQRRSLWLSGCQFESCFPQSFFVDKLVLHHLV